jgi:hypothetical protein
MTGVLVDFSPGLLGVIPTLRYTTPAWHILALSCQTPTLLWGPLLLAVTYSYWARRCR